MSSQVPAARLEFDGRDVSTDIFGEGGCLVSLTITDEAGLQADSIQIELDDREGFKPPAKGSLIKVWLGWEPSPRYMGAYKVDEWVKRGPVRMLSVTARAAELTTSIRAAKTRSWHEKTLGQIAQQIARDHGLTATVDATVAAVAIGHIDQQHESDLGFLSRLARRNGATFKLADGKLLLAAKGSSKLPSGAEKPTLTLKPGMVGSWTATSQGRGNYKSVTCAYMDHATGRRRTVTSGSGAPKHRDRRLYGSQGEAREAAKAQLGDQARGQMMVETEAPGMPDVFADADARITDFDVDVDGVYRIKTVSHALDAGGYRTSLSLESKA